MAAAATQRTARTAGVVLRSVDYGDADRVVTLLTVEHGVVAVMARGVRKGSRRFPGAVPPFSILDAEIGLGRGEVGRLAEAVPSRSFPAILADLDRMRGVGAQLEWLRRLLPPRQREPAIFDVVVELLEAAGEADGQDVRRLEIAFRGRVAALLGLEPNLERCASCGRAPGPGQAARFDPGSGGIVCRACGGGPFTLSGPARQGLRQSFGEDWRSAFQAGPALASAGTASPIAGAEQVLGAFLDHHARR